MHRIGGVLLAALLLCGCSAVRSPEQTAQAVREAYSGAETITVTASIVSNLDEETMRYQLQYTYKKETDSAELKVLQPESIAGIRATISGDDFTFSYEDAALETAMPDQKGFTPADVLPYLLEDIRESEPEQVWRENGRLALRYESDGEAGTSVKEVYVDPDDYALTQAHIYRGGEQILDCTFETVLEKS